MGEGNQERNIMILFLSNLHGEWLKQKDKDTGKEKRTNIMQDDKEEKLYTIFHMGKALCKETNEAPMADVLASLGKPLDAIFYFSTKQVGMYPPPKGTKLGNHITVLFPPAFNVPKEYDSEAHFFWTERAPKVLGDKFTDTTRLIPVPLDESASNPTEGIIESVTAMEQAIRSYLAQEKVLEQGEKPLRHCHLYVDVTGGLRTANMVMSAVMQLLVYQDAKLERVVYSDYQTRKVSNVQPINDMYKLVAGVDAFTKYGSSAALDEYFKDVKAEYEPLGNLLDAMNSFSESVLLCQTDAIKKNLKELMSKLHDFEKDRGAERPAKAELFARMTDELKYVYGKLFSKTSGEPDDIEIIQWCTDNSLIQQALTLCTEWLPEYLTDHGAVYTDVLDIQSYCMSLEESKEARGKKYLLMKFLSQAPGEKVMKKIYANATRRVLKGLISPHLPVNQGKVFPENQIIRFEKEAKKVLPADFLNKFMELLKSIPTDFMKMKNKEPVNNKLLRAIVNKIVDSENKIREQQAKGKPFRKFTVSHLTEDIIWEKLDGWCSDLQLYYEVLKLPHPLQTYYYGMSEIDNKATASGKAEENILWIGKISNNGVNIGRKMLAGNMLQSDLSVDEALEYIRGYTYIRADLRNKINHASKETIKTNLRKVESDINEYLNLLHKIRDRKHTHVGLWVEDMKETAP